MTATSHFSVIQRCNTAAPVLVVAGSDVVLLEPHREPLIAMLSGRDYAVHFRVWLRSVPTAGVELCDDASASCALCITVGGRDAGEAEVVEAHGSWNAEPVVLVHRGVFDELRPLRLVARIAGDGQRQVEAMAAVQLFDFTTVNARGAAQRRAAAPAWPPRPRP